MSIPTPTTKAVADNIVAQLESELNQNIPLLPKAFNRVLAQALAAVLMIVYKYGGWIFLQMFVSRASNEYFEINGQLVNPLVEWGTLIGAGPPEAATQAELLLQVTVLSQGGTLPSGTQLIGATNGVTYLTTTSVLLNTSVVTVNARAVSDQQGTGGAGVIGNLPLGAIVNFANSQPDLEQRTVVTGSTVTGADAELTGAYRDRVIQLFQKRPQGGAYIDYGIWGLEPEGIAAIYPYTGEPGEVDVYVESATEPNRVPTGPQLQSVYNSIQFDQNGLASRRPANAFVNVYPITNVPFTVEVFGITDVDDQAATQTLIVESINAYFEQRAPYIDGYTTGLNASTVSNNSIAAIVTDIVNSQGGLFSGTTLKLFTVPIPLYGLNDGELAVLDSIDVEFA